jgi:hypothetical protein
VLKNRTPIKIEQAVVALAIDQPAWGQVRVSEALKRRGLSISPAGVRCVWLRHDLTSIKHRLKAVEAKVAPDCVLLTEAQIAVLEKAKADKEAYISVVNRLIRRIISWRAPELTLVRALADAFEIVAEGSPADWRSISRRSNAAHYIGIAADVLEGPIARKFVASAGPRGATSIQARLLMAGAALRSKIAWLATPRAETREFLARALAKELLIATTGDLDRLEYVELEAADAPCVHWVTRLHATVSWAAFGFGPAIFVVVNKWAGWVTDPAATGILVQFAALCFFVAVLSATDPTGYKDRLGSVTGTGAALFGWKRPEKKD